MLFAASVAGMLGLASCSDMGSGPDPNPPKVGTGISFQNAISPTLQTYCVGCHGGSGGFFVTSVTSITSSGNHGPNVLPGDGANSNMVKKLTATPPFGDRMPQGGPYMSAEFIDTLRMWIDQGAKDN